MGELVDFMKRKKLSKPEKTVQDVFDTLTDEQKNIVYFLVGTAIEDTQRQALEAWGLI